MTRLYDAGLLLLLPALAAGGSAGLPAEDGWSWGALLLAVPVALAWAWVRGGRP